MKTHLKGTWRRCADAWLCLLVVIASATGSANAAAPQNPGDDSIGQGRGDAESSAISQSNYLLQPYDLIHIVVFQEPDLERQVRLSENSTVNLPLIGALSLRGKTIGEAQKLIRDRYDRDYLVDPQITVTVLEFAKETVNVLGSVGSPGAIPIPPDQPLYLVDAITRAGGFTRLADRRKVRVTQGGNGGATLIVNVDDIIQNHNGSQNVPLHKGDVIYVPERIL